MWLNEGSYEIPLYLGRPLEKAPFTAEAGGSQQYFNTLSVFSHI